MINVNQISVKELKEKLDNKENIKLIDVREENEYQKCHIEGSILLPLSEFANRALKMTKPDEEIVIHCHHGGRAQKACEYLLSYGYKNVSNLKDGIEAWSLEIDPSVPRY